jgi:hypothetical protein
MTCGASSYERLRTCSAQALIRILGSRGERWRCGRLRSPGVLFNLERVR